MRLLAILLAVAITLGGCAGKDVPADWLAVIDGDPLDPPKLPAECTSADRRWQDLPDADVTQSDGARNYRRNKDAFAELSAKRNVCRAAIKAQLAGN